MSNPNGACAPASTLSAGSPTANSLVRIDGGELDVNLAVNVSMDIRGILPEESWLTDKACGRWDAVDPDEIPGVEESGLMLMVHEAIQKAVEPYLGSIEELILHGWISAARKTYAKLQAEAEAQPTPTLVPAQVFLESDGSFHVVGWGEEA